MGVIRRLVNLCGTALGCVTLPLWLPLAIVLSMTDIGPWISGRLLARRMKRAGRFVGPKLAASAGGTIIRDVPGFNGLTCLWWTPDDVAALAPMPEPAGEERNAEPFRWHPFDQWLWEQYLNPDRGKALLIGTSVRPTWLADLRQRYPPCNVIPSYSAGRWEERLECMDEPGSPGEDPKS